VENTIKQAVAYMHAWRQTLTFAALPVPASWCANEPSNIISSFSDMPNF
jgi:hypothetical protein